MCRLSRRYLSSAWAADRSAEGFAFPLEVGLRRVDGFMRENQIVVRAFLSRPLKPSQRVRRPRTVRSERRYGAPGSHRRRQRILAFHLFGQEQSSLRPVGALRAPPAWAFLASGAKRRACYLLQAGIPRMNAELA